MFDSVSVGTTFREQLARVGVIFCSFSRAVQHHPELIERYLGSVVPPGDNFYAALNSAVFSDGSFVYIPAGVQCPMELSSYFRINARNTGQFERTLIIARPAAASATSKAARRRSATSTSCTRWWWSWWRTRTRTSIFDGAELVPGRRQGRGGIHNFVTKRGLCAGARSHIAWTQIETGSAITWKYPSVVLRGDARAASSIRSR